MSHWSGSDQKPVLERTRSIREHLWTLGPGAPASPLWPLNPCVRRRKSPSLMTAQAASIRASPCTHLQEVLWVQGFLEVLVPLVYPVKMTELAEQSIWNILLELHSCNPNQLVFGPAPCTHRFSRFSWSAIFSHFSRLTLQTKNMFSFFDCKDLLHLCQHHWLLVC